VETADSGATLARALTPLLYVQRDEWFPLDRIIAVLHQTQRLVALPLICGATTSTVPEFRLRSPTDEKIVGAAADTTRASTGIWTFWHADVLQADWRDHGQVAINFQWETRIRFLTGSWRLATPGTAISRH
jgi:hypothetical protein